MAARRIKGSQATRAKKPERLEQLLEPFFENKLPRHPSWLKHMRLALKHLNAQKINTHAQLVTRIEALPAKLRSDGVYVLSGIGRKSDAPVLIRILKTDRSLRVRTEASVALGEILGARAIMALEQIAIDSSQPDRLRWESVYQLSFGSPGQKVDLFTNLAANPEEHPLIRGQAAEGIANCGGGNRRRAAFRRAEKVMLDCLKDPHGEVRFWATFALGGMDSKAALPELKRLAKTDHFVGTMGWENCEEAKDTIEIINGRFPVTFASDRRGTNPLKPDYKWPWSF